MPIQFEKLSVLIVEDMAPMQSLLSSVLETIGIRRVYNAPDGAAGFEKFKEINPDIVIADWHMAPVDGIALTREIRTNTLSPDRMTPVILMTGYSAAPRVAEARDIGVTEFMVKPFTATDLARRITHVINKPRDFIDLDEFFGPDRRRRIDENYKGPERRTPDE